MTPASLWHLIKCCIIVIIIFLLSNDCPSQTSTAHCHCKKTRQWEMALTWKRTQVTIETCEAAIWSTDWRLTKPNLVSCLQFADFVRQCLVVQCRVLHFQHPSPLKSPLSPSPKNRDTVCSTNHNIELFNSRGASLPVRTWFLQLNTRKIPKLLSVSSHAICTLWCARCCYWYRPQETRVVRNQSWVQLTLHNYLDCR